jgi:uncharacterized membrane protein YesL
LEEKMSRPKREFGEGPLFTIADYVSWFLLGNLYFLLLNIPLIIIVMLLLPNGTNPLPQGFIYIVALCCIPLGPSITALLSVMGKLVREKDINITKDFFKAYKVNFSQSLFFGFLETIIMFSLYLDVKFFISSGYSNALVVLAFMFMILILLLSLHLFPIISRFYFSKKDILKISAYYTIKKFKNTLLNFCIILLAVLIFFKISNIIAVFIFSITCYGIMFYEQKILIEIEDKFVKKTS